MDLSQIIEEAFSETDSLVNGIGNKEDSQPVINNVFTKMSTGKGLQEIITDDELEELLVKYFDIVFMDPPYGKELEKEVLTYLATSKLIDEDSLIIVEMSDRTAFDYVHELGFTVEKLKKYKTNMHLFLKRAGQKED